MKAVSVNPADYNVRKRAEPPKEIKNGRYHHDVLGSMWLRQSISNAHKLAI